MAHFEVTIDREVINSASSFDDVLDGIFREIGQTDQSILASILAEPDFNRFSELIEAAIGPSGLMEFATYDLGDALRKGGVTKGYKIVRIVAGNPLIMRKMAASTPHAGSYAPITILVFEEDDMVKLAYDRMESYLRSFADDEAMEVARALDAKVLDLLHRAAGMSKQSHQSKSA